MSGTNDNLNKQRDRSASAVKADSLIRRVLRIGDPWNADEVAAGLKRLYTGEESALANEAAGFPVARQAKMVFEQKTRDTATSKDLEQARDDVERDLNALVNNNLLKDIQPELTGWASAIRATISEGVNSARFALDPRQRDNTFASRRSLRDFSRLARYVGALSPHVNPYYRRLGQSLDEVGSVLLVMLGEQLAEIGLSGSGVVLQAPASELQDRRDAIMQTLRALIGSKHIAYGNGEWPWGMAAYRELMQRLDRNGQSDLRALLHEDNMGRLLDDLLDQATLDGSKGLRALSASAQVPLQRLQRLFLAAYRNIEPEAPPIAAFLSAIQLMLDAFVMGDSASRLIYISRPPVLYYGLYGLSTPQGDTQTLIELIQMRGNLATSLDCSLDCNCDNQAIVSQILGDKALYDIDHSIDLFIQGQQTGGIPEYRQRAAGYARFFQVLVENGEVSWDDENGVTHTQSWLFTDFISDILNDVFGLLNLNDPAVDRDIASDALCQQLLTEDSWRRLVRIMAPSCRNPQLAADVIEATLGVALTGLGHNIANCRNIQIDIPTTMETALEGITNRRGRDGSFV